MYLFKQFPLVTFVVTLNCLGHLPSTRADIENVRGPDPDLDRVSGRDEESLKTLRLVQFVHRHGIRNMRKSVLEMSPVFRQSPPFEGYHQLTQAGKFEMFKVGQVLQRRYNGFLNPAYNIRQILVKSKDIGRCIQSAQAIQLGLFPEVPGYPGADAKWNLVPVHSITRGVDNISDMNKDYHCPRLRQLDMEVQTGQSTLTLLPKVYNYVNRLFSSNVTGPMGLFYMWQGWTTMVANGLPVPISATASCQINRLLTKILTDHFVKPEAQQLYFGPMFTELMGNVDKVLAFNGTWNPADVQEDEDHKLAYQFSTSSIQLMCFLNILHLPIYSIPPLGATILMELHQEPEIVPYLRFFYKNRTDVPPYELTSNTCGTPCTVEALKEKYAYLLDVTQNFTERCVADPNSPPGAPDLG